MPRRSLRPENTHNLQRQADLADMREVVNGIQDLWKAFKS